MITTAAKIFILLGVVFLCLVALYKIVKFFIILANPDNLPGFNLFTTWWRK